MQNAFFVPGGVLFKISVSWPRWFCSFYRYHCVIVLSSLLFPCWKHSIQVSDAVLILARLLVGSGTHCKHQLFDAMLTSMLSSGAILCE